MHYPRNDNGKSAFRQYGDASVKMLALLSLHCHDQKAQPCCGNLPPSQNTHCNMDNNAIFDKSDKGREEIVTRKYKLAPRLRSLLVLVDGKKSSGELLQQVAGLGLAQDSLDQLYEQQFIEPSATPPAMAKPIPSQPLPDNQPSNPQVDVLSAPQSGTGNGSLIGASQLLALQTFFNTTIKSTVGLRGFTLQLKVERAMSLDDFRNLRQPYFDAVAKAKGQEMAVALRERLDQLLRDAEQSMY